MSGQRTLLQPHGAVDRVVRSWPTSIGPLVGAHVSKVDDMLAVQTVEKDSKVVGFDLADGDAEHLHPRRGNGQKGVCAHGSDSMPSVEASSCSSAGMILVQSCFSGSSSWIGMSGVTSKAVANKQTEVRSRAIIIGRERWEC